MTTLDNPTPPNIAIMAFGNPCRSDDGVGMYVIEQLKKNYPNQPQLTLLDMGTGSFELLFKLKGHQKIILIDAVLNSGEADGTIFKLPAAELMQMPQEDPMVFLHSMKWDQALSYAKKILQADFPEDITTYLLAITHTKLDIQLSEQVIAGADKLVETLQTTLNRIFAVPKV